MSVVIRRLIFISAVSFAEINGITNMKLLSITLATLVAAAIALPAPKDTYSIMKRQLGSDNNEGEGAPWKRADVSNKKTITPSGF